MQDAPATISLKVPNGIHRRAKAMAALSGKSLSAYVADLLEAHFAKSGAAMQLPANHAPLGGSPAAATKPGDGTKDGGERT